MAKSPQGATPLKVLFIGNSFTARNDLPGMVSALASAAGLTFDYDLISAGGASLRMRHVQKQLAREALRDVGRMRQVGLQRAGAHKGPLMLRTSGA